MLRVALRTRPRPSHLRVPFILERHFESETSSNAPPFAHMFRDTIESMNKSHRAVQQDLTAAHERQVLAATAAHERQVAAYERQVLALRRELKGSQRETTQARVDLVKKVSAHLHVIEGLKMDLHKIQNKLNLRSAVEIIAYTLDERCYSLNLANPATGTGVQKIIDAAVRGGYDDGVATFEKSKGVVIKAVTIRGGVKHAEVHNALRTLYRDLSKEFHPGLSEIVAVHEGKQNIHEAIAAMSIIHFAQHVYGSNLDAVYHDADNKPQFTVSAL